MEFTIQKLLKEAPYLGILLIFLAGIIGGLGTCGLARLPVIFGFVAGTADSRKKARLTALFFISGFILSYTLLGASLGYLGRTAWQLMKINQYIFMTLGLVLLLAGLFISGLIPFKFHFFHHHLAGKFKNLGYLGAFLFGSVFVFFEMPTCPCCGPILLFLAGIAVTSKVPWAILIFLTLALGQSIPLILIGSSTSFINFLSPKVAQYKEQIKLISGNILIIMALYFLLVA